jgi:Arc/MetJ-type ribon-helix-helix transcriptional regulator
MVQKQKLTEKRTFQAAVRLSKEDYSKIKQLVEAGLYKNFAEFLRDAARDKLETMGILSVQEVDDAAAERMIEDYLSAHPGPRYVSEIADALGLEYSVAFRVVHKLLEEGRAERAKK